MQENKLIEIPEYTKSVPFTLSETDLTYLEGDIFHPNSRTTFDVFKAKSKKANEYYIQNSSYAGVIQLSDKRIKFSTKVNTNLFYIMSFLKSESEFLFDPEKSIEIKDGQNFFDIIGRLFANELQEIINHGILKKYITKEENLKYLKSKLNFTKQLQNNIRGHPQFWCIYHDLTFDNQENRIVLRALKELIQLIRFNRALKEELISLEYFLRDYVSLFDVTPQDCDLIQFNRLNERYKSIISFSKIILEEKYIRSTEKGHAKGFNFIVNMNKVFEDFITEIIKEIIIKEEQYTNFSILTQTPFKSLDEDHKLKIIADVLIKDIKNDVFPLILDTKYKKHDANADYYQIISYALAIPTVVNCCLIYPKDFIDHDTLIINRNLLRPKETIKILIRGIDLKIDEEIGYRNYIRNIKDQIVEKILDPCLLNTNI